MMKPSVIASSAAKKRARARGKPGVPINTMDFLKVLDVISKRLDILEKEVRSKRDY